MRWIPAAVLFVLGFAPTVAAALAWTEGEGHRFAEVRPEAGGKPGFTLTDPRDTGVLFTNTLEGDAYLTNAVAHNGSGVAIGDVDADGWPDLYFCSLQGPNRLYRNLGNWRFEELTLGDAACGEQYSTGAAFADVDGNGSLDLLVNGIASGTRLFLNDGHGRFREVADSGFSRTASATSLALADIDADGDLDVYCAHYIDVMNLADPTTHFALARRGDRWVVTKVNGESALSPKWKDRFEALADGSVRELPEYDGLYRNEGNGRFVSILFEPGVFQDENGQPVPPTRDWGQAVMFRDLNGDGAPDFYVCNDNASPDRAWLNTGQGTFRAFPRSSLRHTSRSSMAVDFADVDRDGCDDILVLDMLALEHQKRMTQLVRDRPKGFEWEEIDSQPRYNRNMLFLGRPDGSYAEVALLAGVAATGWSWAPLFVDVDLDGYEDLLVMTGFGMDVMDQDSHDELRQRRMTDAERKRFRKHHPAWPTKSIAFRNRGDATFEIMDQWGFDRIGIANGAALGDLDNDGDLDVVANALNAPAALYRNNASAGRVAVRLKGRPPNTRAVGARIRLLGGSMVQSQEMIAGGRYMSGEQALRVFAAAPDSGGGSLQLEVRWPNGERSTFNGVQANRVYEIDQPESASSSELTNASPAAPLFSEVSSLIGHVHTEAPFDDWARQPLLPRRLSRLGPGVSWYDVNGDGWEDLLVGSGRGGRLAVYVNNEGRGFRRLDGTAEAAGDQGTILGWADGQGNRHVLIAMSNYELPAPAPSQVLVLTATNLAVTEQLTAGTGCLGPMALADIDGDGDLDLFAGGYCDPGRYPMPASSAIWRNDQGKLVPGGSLNDPFRGIGLVRGATFADLDGDTDPDLALATEWGPVRVFQNEGGSFRDVTAPWGFAGLTGWWTSVVAGDFDGDGRVDLACGNWGRNSIYELYRPTTLRVFHGGWNGDNVVESIEAWQRGGSWLPVRDRTWLARGWPDLVDRFPTHMAFGNATLSEILPPGHENSAYLEASHLASTVFLNRGTAFEAVPLPRESQVAPVFAVNVGDFDGDGREDLFLSQNFFGTTSDLTRDDGGRGVWLRGKGNGRFEAVDGSVTGIKVLGEQRGAALADFDHDGRVDVAVSQNRAATRLYANRGGKPGLRVVLRGPAVNPDGVGAQIRVVYAGARLGPARIVQAGSGYWSQDAAAQVLGLQEKPVALSIRWPGGQEQTLPVNEREWTLQIDFKP